ncbi:MAG: YitT family protein [Candidatus Izimaplasma sp.]|nr:YitT family protein [Candidatus Izimaplasma bacterium]
MFKHKKLRKITKYEQYAMITVGIILMALGFYYFLFPAELVAGGVSGLALVFNKLYEFKLSYIVFAFNLILLAFALIFLGKKVFIKSIYGSILFPITLYLFEYFLPLIDIQGDYVLAVTFGGVFLGVGFGLVIKYGGTSGGTDIPIKILNKRLKLPLSVSIYLVDGFIILLGVIVFYADYGIVNGLYAIITMVISGKVADIVIVGSNSKKAVQIITDFPNEIKEAIYNAVYRGVTEIEILGGYSKTRKTMLVTVITRSEYYLVRNIVARIDETAFVYVTSATEIQGDFEERESDE